MNHECRCFFDGDVVCIKKTNERMVVVKVERNGTIWCRPWWWRFFGAKIGMYADELELL